MASKDMALVEAFLSGFVKGLAKEFPDDIDFILLFGSAARGEFRAGTSDVDLIIQLKRKRSMARLERFAEKLFWELDRKHGTKLAQVCSTKRGDLLGEAEEKVKLYKPFEVLAPGEINWSEGRIEARGLGAFAVIAPIHQFARKLKAEGKILYGRDIRKEIRIQGSLIEDLKTVFIPYALSLTALPLCLILPAKALKYSIKAVLYSVDSQLTILTSSDVKRTPFKMKMLRSELGELYSVRLAKEALYARINWDKAMREWTYIDKVAFCLQAPVYISYNNLLSLARMLGR